MQEKGFSDFQYENLGDCEIDLISFIGKLVRLNIVDPYQNRNITVGFKDVEYFLFETNHTQNVIQGIYIYRDIASALSNGKFKSFLEEKNIIIEDNSKYIAYIQPIAGSEGIIVFDEISYFATKI